MSDLIIYLAVFSTMGMLFWFGFLIGFTNGRKAKKKKRKTKSLTTRIYCFDCEIEMPVKEKNGKFYCSNCGLIHWTNGLV